MFKCTFGLIVATKILFVYHVSLQLTNNIQQKEVRQHRSAGGL